MQQKKYKRERRKKTYLKGQTIRTFFSENSSFVILYLRITLQLIMQFKNVVKFWLLCNPFLCGTGNQDFFHFDPIL